MIEKTAEITSLDISQVPVMNSLFDTLYRNALGIKYTNRVQTLSTVSQNELVVYDNDAGDIGVFLITAKGNLIELQWQENSDSTIINTAGALVDADGDTMVQVEESDDEDIIRFDTGDTQGGTAGERATIDYEGLALTSELKLTLDGRGGDTYGVYNSTTGYTELWTDGTKRIEY